MPPKRILIIEDERDIREVLRYNLSREGFQVVDAADGEAGLELVQSEAPDLILLDLMLPGIDGLEICRRIKADSTTGRIPIVMLTAKGEESDIVLGLGLGADDYVTKPFRVRELVARVRAVLRRADSEPVSEPEARIIRGDLVIDSERHRVTYRGERITLTATEFRLLTTLAGRPGRVFTRDQLVTLVIGDDAAVVDRTIDVHIRAIRKKMAGGADLIETIHGVGYRFREQDG